MSAKVGRDVSDAKASFDVAIIAVRRDWSTRLCVRAHPTSCLLAQRPRIGTRVVMHGENEIVVRRAMSPERDGTAERVHSFGRLPERHEGVALEKMGVCEVRIGGDGTLANGDGVGVAI